MWLCSECYGVRASNLEAGLAELHQTYPDGIESFVEAHSGWDKQTIARVRSDLLMVTQSHCWGN